MRPTMDRRTFLIGAGATTVLAACGGGGSSTGTGDLAAARFSPAFTVAADGTPQRSVWGLADQRGPLQLEDVPPRVVVAIARDGELVVPRVDVGVRADGLPFPYYPVRTTFPEPGIYDIELSWNGGVVQSVIQVFTPEEIPLLGPGDAVPPVETPTVDDARGVDPICTRGEICRFHEQTLAEALDDGLPTVLIVGTPGFCQTAVCGPMLELVIEQHELRDAAFSAVHGEVYRDPQLLRDGTAVTTEVMDAMGLTEAGFEPSVFLIDADGVVVERLDNVVDRSELSESLDALLA